MAYVIAAYGVSVGAVGLYCVHLARERSRLARTLGRGAERPQ